MTKQFKITLVILLIASTALFIGNYYAQKWVDFKMAKVSIGLAESKFPYREYTQEELNKMYPQIKNADVPTRITPEQTYANFRQALKDNNLEMAIEQLSKESREKYEENKKMLEDFYQENKFEELYKYYNEKITQSFMFDTSAQYDFNYYSTEYKINLIGDISFFKNANGDWKMDSL